VTKRALSTAGTRSTPEPPTLALPTDNDASDAANAAPVPPTAAAATDATSAATGFLRAFARTDLAQAAWWAGVAGYLTPTAAALYTDTDVANVPVHQVVDGSATLLPGSTKFRASVAVSTDIGTYTVLLLHTDTQWLVDRTTPPAGVR
jgi:hypothetical protein